MPSEMKSPREKQQEEIASGISTGFVGMYAFAAIMLVLYLRLFLTPETGATVGLYGSIAIIGICILTLAYVFIGGKRDE